MKLSDLVIQYRFPYAGEFSGTFIVMFCLWFQLNNEFQNEESPGAIYAISMAWFRDWENFVRGRSDGKIDRKY